MEQSLREYADWIEDEACAPGEDPVEEMLRAREDEKRCPVQAWLVPVVDDVDRCIRERFSTLILQELRCNSVIPTATSAFAFKDHGVIAAACLI